MSEQDAPRLLYFGTYDRDHPRNTNAIAALRDAGVEVLERGVALRRGTGARGLIGVLAAETRLLAPRRDAFDAIVVGYPGHFDVPRARRVAGKRPLVFDAVLSLADEFVTVRRTYKPRSFAARALSATDVRALKLADLVVADTEANAGFLAEAAQIPRARVTAVFLGADEQLFAHEWAPAYPFGALHVADRSEQTVRAAGALVPELPMRVTEPGELDRDALGIAVAHAGILLAGLGESRSIPAIVFGALATGTPVVTADTAAARELLVDGESALLVRPDDPAAAAAALRSLAADTDLRGRVGAGARAAYVERASVPVLGRRWRALLEALL